MEEKRMFLVSEEDLRSIMNEVVHETIHEMIRTDRHGDMDDIMTVTDISELIGVDRRNLNGSQKYYLPFDRPEYRTKDGVRGWKRRDVLEHLARRDSDIRKSYETFQKVADGQSTKIIIPSDIKPLATAATAIKEIISNDNK